MPVFRDHPYEGSSFRVDLGEVVGLGFRTVELPVAQIAEVVYRPGNDKDQAPQKRPGLTSYGQLVLTREVTGRTELSDWWNQTRAGHDDGILRSVVVRLLDEGHEPVWTWKFTGAFPTAYRFSTLDATSSAALDEIIELTFETMSIE